MLKNLYQLDRIAGKTIIQFTDNDPTTLNVDAIVEEQDTNLLLGNASVFIEAIDNYPELLEQMGQQVREIPGNVIVKKSQPKRLIAIVYDVDHTPICEESWIKEVLDEIILQCYEHNIKTIAMPLLGTSYGKLSDIQIIDLLQDRLIHNKSQKPKKILIYNKKGI